MRCTVSALAGPAARLDCFIQTNSDSDRIGHRAVEQTGLGCVVPRLDGLLLFVLNDCLFAPKVDPGLPGLWPLHLHDFFGLLFD